MYQPTFIMYVFSQDCNIPQSMMLIQYTTKTTVFNKRLNPTGGQLNLLQIT